MAVTAEGARRKERVLCLFDVDGTLTPARQVGRPAGPGTRPPVGTCDRGRGGVGRDAACGTQASALAAWGGLGDDVLGDPGPHAEVLQKGKDWRGAPGWHCTQPGRGTDLQLRDVFAKNLKGSRLGPSFQASEFICHRMKCHRGVGHLRAWSRGLL